MINSIGSKLKWGATLATVAQVTKIKTIPDLGGAPSAVEVTDLEDEYQRYEEGVQALTPPEFTCNYSKDVFEAVVDDEDTELWYQVEFGDGSLFVWQGTHNAYPTAVGVDGKPEFKIVITPSTAPTIIPSLLTVAIPGTPQQGVATGALTKTYSAIPLATPTFAYQWKRANTAGGTYSNITGATSATYTPVADDVGKYLKCQVTASVYATKTVLSTASAQIIGA
jgi:hypothetical protein